jgi:hypothetical protein
MIKPLGGIYTAPHTPDETWMSPWHQYIDTEYQTFHEGKPLFGHIYHVEDAARVLNIEHAEHLLKIAMIYPKLVENKFERAYTGREKYTLQIDWPRLARRYDGVHFSQELIEAASAPRVLPKWAFDGKDVTFPGTDNFDTAQTVWFHHNKLRHVKSVPIRQ